MHRPSLQPSPSVGGTHSKFEARRISRCQGRVGRGEEGWRRERKELGGQSTGRQEEGICRSKEALNRKQCERKLSDFCFLWGMGKVVGEWVGRSIRTVS